MTEVDGTVLKLFRSGEIGIDQQRRLDEAHHSRAD